MGELGPGQRVGNYVICERVGAGGMGAVYRAEHPQIGRQVAIKVLAAHLGQQAGIAERFLAEARAVNRIDHPNIIEIYDFGQTEDGQLYYTMELLRGEELSALIAERGAMAPAEVLRYLEPVGAALSAAHEEGVVHRDLKPENVFVLSREPPRVKVLDFGIAKLLEGDGGVGRTSTGMIIGSPLTIAPEQAAGVPDKISPRTDIYALGVIAYWMLAGKPPFAATAPGMLIAQHITAPPPSLAAAAPGLPQAIVDLVHQCLAKEPEQRPASVGELVARLGAKAAPMASPVVAPAASPPTEIGPPPAVAPVATTLQGAAGEMASAGGPPAGQRSGKAALILGALVAVVVLGGVGGTYLMLSRRGEADAPRHRAEAAEAERRRRAASAAQPVPRATAPVKRQVAKAPAPAAATPPMPPDQGAEKTQPKEVPQVPAAQLSGADVRGSSPGLRYRARLSARDHVNSHGRPLASAAKIVRQDRANYHRYGVRDAEDEGDPVFAGKGARATLQRRLRFAPGARRAIVGGTPLIEVLELGGGALLVRVVRR